MRALVFLVTYLSYTFAQESSEAGEPLFLTPLIHANKLNEARNLSRVEPFLDNIDSYSGFLTVDNATRSHLFFWLFLKSGHDAKTSVNAPLILWLGGGPGMSSLIGLFSGTGPFKARGDENCTFLEEQNSTWTKNYHVLYIDQPVGAGFSFTEGDGYVNSTEKAADHLYIAIDQFYTLFAEFQNYDLYIAGESYAGKFIPATAFKIHETNKQKKDKRLRLKGMVIGNGFTDPENMLDFDMVLQAAGLIDERERRVLSAKEYAIQQFITSRNWTAGYSSLWDFLNNDVGSMMSTPNYYDYRREEEGYFDYTYVYFVDKNATRQRLHVGQVPYEFFSPKVPIDFESDTLQTVRPFVEKLLEWYPMMFYNGLFDLLCAPMLTEHFLSQMHWSTNRKFDMAQKQTLRIGNKLVGYYKKTANLVYVTVRDAGHSVTLDQPEIARDMIDMFIGEKFINSSTIGRDRR